MFLPLATEPETTLSVLSPEYFFQHEAIVAIARDLPAGVLLVVKEAVYALGRRQPEFYKQVKDLKNVVLLHPEERALDVMKRSLAVACIAGTAGYEAAAMGIPVVSFGRHNLFGFMDHVFVIRDNTELKDALAVICNGDINLEQAWRDGARFFATIMKISFEMPNFNILDRASYNDEGLENAYNSLIESMPKSRVFK